MHPRLPSIALCALLAACAPDPAPPDAAPPAAGSAAVAPAPTPSQGPLRLAEGDGLATALARTAASVAGGRAKAADQPTDWSGWASAASALLQRARLTGSYDDYAAAEEALEAAFARATPGTGPFVLRARLNATLHRLDRVDADLDVVKDWPAAGLHKPSRAVAVRAGVDFQRGRIDDAKRGWAEAMRLQSGWPTPVAGLALAHWKTGDFESAEGLYGDCLALLGDSPGEPLAWTHLQLGLMDLDRERYAEALAHYVDADAALPGYWLVHEHIAEVLRLLGRRDEARALYARVVADTGGAPEFLDAQAEMAREDGDEDAARALIARSRAKYEARLERFPEATYGHALDHFGTFGPPARALELARKNHALRPGGDAKTGLVEALLAAGEAAEAAKVADELEASAWDTADSRAAIAAARAATP